MFEVLATCGKARAGRIHTPHGIVETPAFMPVGTLGTVKAVTQDVLEELGAQIILGNTYHLFLRPGHERIQRMGGLHKFMSWPRAILTDSGGFQVFSLAALRKVSEEGVKFRSHLDGSEQFLSPESAIDVQRALGSDIMMVLDECTEYPVSHERAKQSMEMTLRWARRGCDHWRKDPGAGSLFGIVQGSSYKDLRCESAARTVEMDFPGYAIGGLAVGEPRALTYELVQEVEPLLPRDRPRYAMGVGLPEELPQYIAQGIDMMDCVLPTRNARNGMLFTSEGRVIIRHTCYSEDQRPVDERCGCPVCRRYTRAYLRHLFLSNEILSSVLNTVHNLYFYLDTVRKIRQAILVGTFQNSF